MVTKKTKVDANGNTIWQVDYNDEGKVNTVTKYKNDGTVKATTKPMSIRMAQLERR